jgi:hypothetical protein
MRNVTISDELFEELKTFVVDPFDDTPDLVIGRLIAIVKKAKSRWSPLEECEAAPESKAPSKPKAVQFDEVSQQEEEEPVVLL